MRRAATTAQASFLARAVARAAPAVPRGAAARMRSTAPTTPVDAHHMASANTWVKVTVGGCVAVVLAGIYSFAKAGHHEHHAPAYAYLKIRNKPFPWECPDCGFFEADCHRKCQAAKAAGN